MKKRTFWQKVGDFLNGKGFYMALAVCLCAIGLSGWYLWQTMSTAGKNVSQAVGGEATVTVTGANDQDEVPPEVTGTNQQDNTDTETGLSDGQDAAQTGGDPSNQDAAQTSGEAGDSSNQDAAQTSGDVGDSPEQDAAQTSGNGSAPQETTETSSKGDTKPVGNPVETVDNLYQTMQYPVPGQVVAVFSAGSLTYNEVMGDWRTHDGVDLSAQEGDQVVAAWAGKVTSVKEDAVLGVTVTVDCGEGYTTLYGNLAKDTAVSAGDEVAEGAPIGTVGTTAAGELGEGENFLHFSVSKDGAYLDPTQFFTPAGK